MPVLSYSNKLLTLAQQIGSTEKEKLRAFSRGLDASIKYGIRNLKPATYEEALALPQNKELELNNGKPKQPTSTTSSQQTNGKSQVSKTAKANTPSKPKMTPDEKAKAGVIGGYLTLEEQKAYMVEQRCFGCHVKGHRKQDCAKWKERQQASTSAVAASPASKTPASLSTPLVAHLVPSLRQPQVVLDDKQEGVPTRLGLLRAYGSAKGHSFTILFDTGSEEDLLSPQLATKLQCTMQPFDLDVDAFTPGIRTRITQIATKVPFGKAAFFPGKLVHTNELLVLLGEGYYVECSASKSLEILGRRCKLLGSQMTGVKSQLADLNTEFRFLNETFAEAAAGCVEIREDFLESTSSDSVGTVEPEPSDYVSANYNSHVDGRLAASKELVLSDDDKEHELLMARLDELAAAEAAAEMDFKYRKTKSTGFEGTSAGFQLSEQEKSDSLTDIGFKTSERKPNLDYFTVDKHSQRVVEKDHYRAAEMATMCGAIEGQPNLRSPGDLMKFEEWRRCNFGKGNSNQITEMKRKLSPTGHEVQEPVNTYKSFDHVAPVSTEGQGGTKSSIVHKVFTGSVIERAGPIPSTELSQASRHSQKRPVSKFKTRQANK
ncbi:hypothetical protein L7F22_001191 [Adiantum nelumboides]|nr:hypothetical protein [Adiantum nelumboides]